MFWFKKTLRLLTWLVILGLFVLFLPRPVRASDFNLECGNRFLTLVNPVRGRSFWLDKSLKPIKDQYSIIESAGLSATWLLQYEVLTDLELVSYLKTYNSDQELGLFLEVTPKLCEKTEVVYPHGVSWANPKAIFLSGYTQKERRLLIDEIFHKFKTEFGQYPKAVGAWWIDSYSLDYMVRRYGINSVLIVADQKTTDNYGVWGQWWGMPYYPSRINVLVPAQTKNDKLNVVVTQWAQRDFLLAMGEGYTFSNYSLQANDYTKQGKNTDYFSNLVQSYFDCQNGLSQITVGLETGMEGFAYLDEYQNQIEFLDSINQLKAVTLSGFYKEFAEIYPETVDGFTLGDKDTAWELTPMYRKNTFLGEEIAYPQKISFPDYFVADSSDFLRRYVDDLGNLKKTNWFPWWFLILGGMLIIYLKKARIVTALSLVSFVFLAYLSLFASFQKYGWQVFYGPSVSNLVLTQISLAFLPLATTYLALSLKKLKLNSFKFVWLLPLTFGFDYFLSVFKYSFLESQHYFGVFWQKTQFLGLKLPSDFSGVSFVSQKFDLSYATSFIFWSLDKTFQNKFIWIVIYPLVHLIFFVILTKIFSKLGRVGRIIFPFVLVVFLIGFIYSVINSGPIAATPILK